MCFPLRKPRSAEMRPCARSWLVSFDEGRSAARLLIPAQYSMETFRNGIPTELTENDFPSCRPHRTEKVMCAM